MGYLKGIHHPVSANDSFLISLRYPLLRPILGTVYHDIPRCSSLRGRHELAWTQGCGAAAAAQRTWSWTSSDPALCRNSRRLAHPNGGTRSLMPWMAPAETLELWEYNHHHLIEGPLVTFIIHWDSFLAGPQKIQCIKVRVYINIYIYIFFKFRYFMKISNFCLFYCSCANNSSLV